MKIVFSLKDQAFTEYGVLLKIKNSIYAGVLTKIFDNRLDNYIDYNMFLKIIIAPELNEKEDFIHYYQAHLPSETVHIDTDDLKINRIKLEQDFYNLEKFNSIINNTKISNTKSYDLSHFKKHFAYNNWFLDSIIPGELNLASKHIFFTIDNNRQINNSSINLQGFRFLDKKELKNSKILTESDYHLIKTETQLLVSIRSNNSPLPSQKVLNNIYIAGQVEIDNFLNNDIINKSKRDFDISLDKDFVFLKFFEKNSFQNAKTIKVNYSISSTINKFNLKYLLKSHANTSFLLYSNIITKIKKLDKLKLTFYNANLPLQKNKELVFVDINNIVKILLSKNHIDITKYIGDKDEEDNY